jgi:solute carrier family 13 (sodium-dependent dicarboxylate transporter), member 2/3/5
MLSSLNKRQKVGLIGGPLLFIVVLLLPLPEGMSPEALRVAAVALLMASFWMAETLPIPVTALLPIFLFPLLGVLSTAETTLRYGDQTNFLFMGGFLIAIAMQKWNLHRRIALNIVSAVGSSPQRLVLGMMLATGLLSMWISNTATVMMMAPVGMAVIQNVRPVHDGTAQPRDNFSIALMLAIGYTASLTGLTTFVGTPPNGIFRGQLEVLYGREIALLDWMTLAVPIALCLMALCWFLLTQVFFPMADANVDNAAARRHLDTELAALGRITPEESRVAWIFALVALAWILRGQLNIPALALVSDSAVAMAGAFMLFVIPASRARGGFLLDWETAVGIPWDVILLMGGGFALAEGFTTTGLTEWLSGQFGALQALPLFVLTLCIVVFITFIGEMTSNAATATMFIPVMGALSVSLGMDPLTLMVPTVLATSLGFMLPVATPPNAIVYASRVMSIEDMVKAGFWLNLGGGLIVTVMCYLLLDVLQ